MMYDMKKKLVLAFLSLGSIFFQIMANDSNYLQKVITTPVLRAQLADYIDHVLGYVNSRDFFGLADKIAVAYHPVSDEDFYEYLLNDIRTIKRGLSLFHRFRSLKQQKKIFAHQAKELLHDKAEIHGCLEIGTSGTYISSLKDYIPFSGSLYVANDKRRLTDMVEAFCYNPLNCFLSYNYFIPLRDYAPLKEKDIPGQSVEVVMCFFGLHQIPLKKLDAFIASLNRVLRSGGVLLIREYDAHTPDRYALIQAAETLYNLIAFEMSEFDVFQLRKANHYHGIQFWIDIVEQHGFKASSVRLIQKGDPTGNTMIRFTKK